MLEDTTSAISIAAMQSRNQQRGQGHAPIDKWRGFFLRELVPRTPDIKSPPQIRIPGTVDDRNTFREFLMRYSRRCRSHSRPAAVCGLHRRGALRRGARHQPQHGTLTSSGPP